LSLDWCGKAKADPSNDKGTTGKGRQVRTESKLLRCGEPFQFGLAPLQDADIFQQPFEAIAVESRNNFGLDG
jgi:hypothetical protein